MTLPIRVRLTLWYVAIMALTLGVFAGGVYEFLERQARGAVEEMLHQRASAFAHEYASEITEEPSEQAAREAAKNFDGEVFVYAGGPRLVAKSGRSPDPSGLPAVRQSIAEALGGRTVMLRVGRSMRAIATPIGGHLAVVALQATAAERESLKRARVAFWLAIPAALLIAAVGGFLLVRRSLAPVAAIAETASRIQAEDLSTRIAIADPGDELGRLGAVLNDLFDRLERSFAQQRQLIADTSHELRTPVTVIRSEAEVALSRERTPEEYRAALEIVRSESAHLTHLIEGVLTLARADARQIRIADEPFSLTAVVLESVRTAGTLARARSVELEPRADGLMPMRGDPELIRRMLLNLLDNAIKFSDAGGRVHVTAEANGSNYIVRVADSGRGIPETDQPKIFDRFYRADPARVRDGQGLGLAIVRWIAEAHHGTVRLASSGPGGSVLEVTLPGARSE